MCVIWAFYSTELVIDEKKKKKLFLEGWGWKLKENPWKNSKMYYFNNDLPGLLLYTFIVMSPAALSSKVTDSVPLGRFTLTIFSYSESK